MLPDVNTAVVMIWLTLLGGPSHQILTALLAEFGSVAGIYDAFAAGKTPLSLGNRASVSARFRDSTLMNRAVELYNKALSAGMDVVPLGAEDYPYKLRNMPSAVPLVLYCYGARSILSDPDCKALAIVGSRHCSSAGEANSREFARELAGRGVLIVSGLARGCDGAAHRGALDAGGVTAAVLASGADVIYPPEHRSLYNEIIRRGGCVLSESPPGTVPQKQLFPARNRIIAGLSDAVLVTEAARRSGALITADRALEADRTVFALPGDVRNPMSFGCNELIRQGAVCASCVGVILEELGIDTGSNTPQAGGGMIIGLPFPQSAVARAVWQGADNVDTIAEKTQLDVATVTGALTMLEIRGAVRQNSFGAFLPVTKPGP